MFFWKHKFHVLFFLSYFGALAIEKPTYLGDSVVDCFSYLLTVIVHFAIFAGMILFNKALLIPYLLETKQFGLYVLGLIGAVLGYTFLIGHYNYFVHGVLFHDIAIGTKSGFWDNFVYALCCSVIAAMVYVTQQWAEQAVTVKNIQINQLETELKYLRLQINPHFLFNGLNSVYGSIDMNNQQARDMMVQFSDLLRYNLYEADVDKIALAKEAHYLENYVALQKARSNENVQVSLNVHIDNGNIKVVPLIFMAFVENAFKYASRDDGANNRIVIDLEESAGRVQLTCVNSYDNNETTPGGIGINNAVRRLDLLYKDRYDLDIKRDNGIFEVILKITL